MRIEKHVVEIRCDHPECLVEKIEEVPYSWSMPEGWTSLRVKEGEYLYYCPQHRPEVSVATDTTRYGEVLGALLECSAVALGVEKHGAALLNAKPSEHVDQVRALRDERDRWRREYSEYYGRWSKLCDLLDVSVTADEETALHDVRELKQDKAIEAARARALLTKVEQLEAELATVTASPDEPA
jgi:hypothetical protein